MDDPSQRRLGIAEGLFAFYRSFPSVSAVIVGGSVARGIADLYSDVDMTLVYDELPSVDELKTVCAQLGAINRKFHVYGEQAIHETYLLGNVRCDMSHWTVQAWERVLVAAVQQRDANRLDIGFHRAVLTVLEGVALFGAPLIQRWRVQVEKFPDELQEAMIKHYLFFHPRWMVEKRAARQDSLLFLYEIFVESEKNILGVLLALNRIYHPFEFKHLAWTARKLSVAPQDLAFRLDRVWRNDPRLAAEDLNSLIDDTFALVRPRMPRPYVEAAWRFFNDPEPILES